MNGAGGLNNCPLHNMGWIGLRSSSRTIVFFGGPVSPILIFNNKRLASKNKHKKSLIFFKSLFGSKIHYLALRF